MVKILICGGGNGAHAFAGIASANANIEVYVLTLYKDEAERWTNSMTQNDFTTKIHDVNNGKLLKTKPHLVIKDPAMETKNCDIIIFAVPAYAHSIFLDAIKSYVKPGMLLIGCPGHAGFDLSVHHILGDIAKECTIMNFESLPWACRIESYGKSVDILGTKKSLVGAAKFCTRWNVETNSLTTFQEVIGKEPVLKVNGSLLGVTLMATNAMIHPTIMYSHWRNWDGTPLEKPPLFYNGIDECAAGIMSAVSDEVIAVAEAIRTLYPAVDLTNVQHIYEWYCRTYKGSYSDGSTLCSLIKTNSAYEGLVHPCKQTTDGKYVPDFEYRYLTEDIPYGLVVIKGIAALAGVATPVIDDVVMWAQGCMGKEYIVDSDIKGKDMEETRTPQVYGITTLEELVKVQGSGN